MRARIVSIAMVLGVVVACSDDEDPNAASQAAIDANAKVLCERIFGCCSQSELADLSFVDVKSPPSMDGCVALHSKNGRDYKPSTDAEAAAGRLAIHLERSDACVAEVRALSCADFHARLLQVHLGDAFSACQSAIVEPLVADGSLCKQYLDCTSGSCEGGVAESPDPKGTCTPFPAVGAACAADGCGRGMRCDPDTTTCRALVAKGDACTYDDECESGGCRNAKCVTPGRCGG